MAAAAQMYRVAEMDVGAGEGEAAAAQEGSATPLQLTTPKTAKRNRLLTLASKRARPVSPAAVQNSALQISMADVVTIKKRASMWKSHHSRVINPKRGGKIAWDLAVGVLILYTVVALPFRLGYSFPACKGGWCWVDCFIDLPFFIDIALCFFTGYFENGELETNLKKIAIKYLTSWFLPDLLSVLPFSSILGAISGQHVPLCDCKGFGSALAANDAAGVFANATQMLTTAAAADDDGGDNSAQLADNAKMLRGLRLLKLAKLMRLFKLSRVFKGFNIEDYVNPAVVKLFSLFLAILLVAHWLSCVWYILKCHSKLVVPGTETPLLAFRAPSCADGQLWKESPPSYEADYSEVRRERERERARETRTDGRTARESDS